MHTWWKQMRWGYQWNYTAKYTSNTLVKLACNMTFLFLKIMTCSVDKIENVIQSSKEGFHDLEPVMFVFCSLSSCMMYFINWKNEVKILHLCLLTSKLSVGGKTLNLEH